MIPLRSLALMGDTLYPNLAKMASTRLEKLPDGGRALANREYFTSSS